MMLDLQGTSAAQGNNMVQGQSWPREAWRTAMGVACSFLVFSASFLLAGHAATYVNIVALLVVFSGTVGATILSAGWEGTRRALRCAGLACRGQAPPVGGVVREILRLSVVLRRVGAMRADDISPEWLPTLASGVELVEDRYTEAEIRDILEAEMHSYAQRIGAHADVLRAMASFAPSFGVAGSVIGLVGIMASLGNVEMILRHIPIALVSTLYGVVFGNFFLAPLGGRIREWLGQQLMLKLVVLEGSCALARNEHTAKLWRRMNAILPPDQRIGEAQLRQLARKQQALDPQGAIEPSQPVGP